jgi:hypothetical protein
MYSDIEGAVLKEGRRQELHKADPGRQDRRESGRILAQSKRGDIEGKEAKAYTATEKYIKENYSKAEANKIFSVLSGQLNDNAGALCCTIGASVDACLDCTSHCHMGNAYTGQALTDIYNSGEKLAAAAGVNNADEAKVLYQSQKKAAIWRPAIVDVLSTRLPGKSTPANMAQMINAWAKKGKIKEEELEWSGLREWLAEQDGKVSKQDILDYLSANHVQVQEVKKGDSDAWTVWDGNDEQYFDTEKEAREYAKEMGLDPGDEDTVFVRGLGNAGTKYGDSNYTTPGLKDYFELVLWSESSGPMTEDSMHFVEGHEGKRQIAWVRAGETTDADGSRVLMIDEIQSKRHQEGRKKGYKSNKDVVGNLKKKYPSLPDDTGQWSLNELEKAGATIDERQEWWDNRMTGTVPNAPFKKTWPMLAMKRMVRYAAENGFDKIAWTPGEVQAERYDLSKQIDSIKVSLRDGGDRHIALVQPTDDGLSALVDSSGVVKKGYGWEGKQLDEVIGKDLAEKVMQATDGAVLRGDDLKVGGEGMKGFYDKILPAAVNKFFGKKAWGSARVGTTDLIKPAKGETGYQAVPSETTGFAWDIVNGAGVIVDQLTQHENPEKYANIAVPEKRTEVWSLPVTPEMRSKALYEGMPLFQDRNKPRGAVSNLLTSMPKIIHAFEAADASTPIHELGHILTSMLSDDSSDDYFALAAWAGVDPDRAEAGIIGWTEDELERVARAFETYVMGRVSPDAAPPAGLRNDARLADRHLQVYQSAGRATHRRGPRCVRPHAGSRLRAGGRHRLRGR